MIIVWFRQDLRLHDNPSLYYAAQNGPILPLFILDDENFGIWKRGGASRLWLHHSLENLSKKLKEKGCDLLLLKGKANEIIPKLIEKTKARGIYWNRCYDPFSIKRDTQIKQCLKNVCEVKTFNGSLLSEPREVVHKKGFFKIFTPYYKHIIDHYPFRPPLPLPVFKGAKWPSLCENEALGLNPSHSWGEKIVKRWQIGEESAWNSLKNFTREKVNFYEGQRDYPFLKSTSCLSPYLHFGEISPHNVWFFLDSLPLREKVTSFKRQLIWREFSYYLLFHFPELPTKPFNPLFNNFSWEPNPLFLSLWKKGKTGYPLVDAGTRELWNTGYMHNRVRMVVSSFLTKHLLIPWQEGAAWFWDTLVDADLANNSAGWQWVAGCGADAAPYFRIFNPILQSEKFDPEGEYIRRWIPELRGMPEKLIHTPWRDETLLKKTGYPTPMIDHNLARERALKVYQEMVSKGKKT